MQCSSQLLSTDQILNSTTLIIGVFIGSNLLDTTLKALDSATQSLLERTLSQGDLNLEIGQSTVLYQSNQSFTQRFIIVNCGKPEEFNELNFKKVLSSAAQLLAQLNVKEAATDLVNLPITTQRSLHWKIRQAVERFHQAFYRFDQLKTSKKPHPKLERLSLLVANTDDLASAQQAIAEGEAIVKSVNWVKNLANLPANICTPTYLATEAQELSKEYPAIETKILDKKEMEELGMGALLAVARGSHQPPKLIVLEYRKGGNCNPIALVGKGVTFDSGGISLKPAERMEEMKFDMSGAATVLGTFKAAAALNLPLNLVGVIPTTENLPGGNATKPGDVVFSLSGQSIEIVNTDAEGRLILADALTYCERFKPEVVIDIATLTGAIVIALGAVACGAMGNDEKLLKTLEQAGQASGDPLWILPLWEDYQEQINSPVADIANVGINGGKSITAACFLSRFTKKFRWAHLDIAGIAWQPGKDRAATGRPVSLLVQYLLDQCS